MAHANNMNTVREKYAEVMSEISSKQLLPNILSQLIGEPVQIEQEGGSISAEILQGEYAIN